MSRWVAGERLAGRVALVTGASSGIGAHLAQLLAGAGARVALAARRREELEKVCARIAATGGQAAAVKMDVLCEESVAAGFDAAEAAFGTVDTIVANAGTTASGPAVDQPVAEFDRVVGINLTGTFLTAREGARRLLATEAPQRGRIIITASVTAMKVDPGLAAYSASKAGVVQMGKVLARECEPGGDQRQHDPAGLYPHRTKPRLVRHRARAPTGGGLCPKASNGGKRPRRGVPFPCL